MPKSATSALPSASRMFSGLMSRCTDAVAMGVVERGGDGAGDVDGVGNGKLMFAVEPRAQRFAVDEGHHVEEEPVGAAGIEERQDVRDAAGRR